MIHHLILRLYFILTSNKKYVIVNIDKILPPTLPRHKKKLTLKY